MVNKIKSGGYIRFCKTSELWLYYKNKQHNLKLKSVVTVENVGCSLMVHIGKVIWHTRAPLLKGAARRYFMFKNKKCTQKQQLIHQQ